MTAAHWKPKPSTLPWKDFLTLEERDKLDEASDAKRHWQELNRERAAITNRAIQRAKYAARKGADRG